MQSLTLLWVDDDAEYRSFVRDALESVSKVDLVMDGDPATAFDHLDDVDAVVADLDAGDRDALGDVRDRNPRRPFIFHTETPLGDAEAAVLAGDHTDYVRKDWDESTVHLVVQRARNLVERNRYFEKAKRLAGAVDACRDPVVVVGPDDAIEYTNGQFASAISPVRTDLCGQHWTELFTEDSVEQLQHEAIPVGTDGWSWNGTAQLAAGDAAVPARITLVHVGDGSKVFTFRDLAQPT